MKIGAVSPSTRFTEDIKVISAQLNIDIHVREGALQQGLYAAKNMIKREETNVMIARGATADLLEKELNIPVAKIRVSTYDILKTMAEAIAETEVTDIYFIDHFNSESLIDLHFIEETLSIQIKLKQYKNENDIHQHIKDIAKVDSEAVIVGTAQCLARSARNMGLTSFVVPSTKEALREALERAAETSRLYEKEKLHQQHLKTIISYAFDGVIATDSDGKISLFNEVAAKLLGLKSEDMVGRVLSKMQHPHIKRLFAEGKAATEVMIKLGSAKYIVNRIPVPETSSGFVITFQETDKLMDLNAQVRSELYHRRFYAKHRFEDIIYESESMQRAVEMAKRYSETDSSVLINGESGVGKELFAQSIHNHSVRDQEPFIAVNCAALPESLLESELFGYEDGAFTGAKKGGKPGLFEMAHQGTLFLDEISELPLSLQGRLLRVLQEKEVMRVGGEKIIPVNVRVISATNMDLARCLFEQKFREDLFYRLNILQIKVPPLRQRKEDVQPIMEMMLRKRDEDYNKIAPAVRQELEEYEWPGNVRELENVLERILALGTVTLSDLKDYILDDTLLKRQADEDAQLQLNIGTLDDIENQVIRQLYERYNGNKTAIAEILGVSRTTLWKKLKAIG